MWHDDTDAGESFVDLARGGLLVTAGAGGTSESLPERALLRAVLQEAILDVRGCATGVPNGERRRAAEQAYYWFLSREVDWPFAFENVCVILGFDADCLRRWVLRDAAIGADARVSADGSPLRRGSMVRAVRAARMRGNQHKGPLKLRRRSRHVVAAAVGASR